MLRPTGSSHISSKAFAESVSVIWMEVLEGECLCDALG